jgi:hypothetical protein
MITKANVSLESSFSRPRGKQFQSAERKAVSLDREESSFSRSRGKQFHSTERKTVSVGREESSFNRPCEKKFDSGEKKAVSVGRERKQFHSADSETEKYLQNINISLACPVEVKLFLFLIN